MALSRTASLAGTSTVTIPGVTGTNAGNVFIQGLALGSTQVTAVAAGYNDATDSVTVDPSGFSAYFPGFATSLTTTAGAANTMMTVRASRLDPITLNIPLTRKCAAVSRCVTVTSSNTAVGVITISPLTFTGGGGPSKSTFFDPLTAGTTTLTLPDPVPGFSSPSNGATSLSVTVNP